MKKIILSTLLLCFSVSITAQNTTWTDAIAKYDKKLFGVEFSVPEGFKANDSRKMVYYFPNMKANDKDSKRDLTLLYSNGIQSEEHDCEVLLPCLFFTSAKADFGKMSFNDESPFKVCTEVCNSEVQNSLLYGGMGDDKKAFAVECSKRIKRLDGGEANAFGNADMVYIADYEVTTKCWGMYTHAMGIYLSKSNKVPLFVKILLTDKGYERRNEIMEQIKNCVKFDNDAWEYNSKAVADEWAKLIKKFNFNTITVVSHAVK